jgi:uracil phosphoribosyltransferase
MRTLFLTQLRDKKSKISIFRSAALKLSHLLAQETLELVKVKKVKIQTPLAETNGEILDKNIVLIPILRSGVALLPTFLYYFEQAKVGFIGLKRDEKTAIAHEYYRNLPKIDKNDQVLLLDPMLATGGSSVDAIKILLDNGAREENIIGVYLISAPSGMALIKKTFPKLRLIIGVEDEALNNKKYILPGIGDFGDRFFGTD